MSPNDKEPSYESCQAEHTYNLHTNLAKLNTFIQLSYQSCQAEHTYNLHRQQSPTTLSQLNDQRMTDHGFEFHHNQAVDK